MTPTHNGPEPVLQGWLGWVVLTTAVATEQCGLLLPDQSVLLALAAAIGWVGFALAARRGTHRLTSVRDVSEQPTPRRAARLTTKAIRCCVAAVVCAAAVASTGVIAPGGGSPEQLLMAVFRGIMLAVAATATTPREEAFAVGISVFLVTFSTIVVEHGGAWVAETLYALSAAAMLMAASRHSLQRPGGTRSRWVRLPHPTQAAALLAVVIVVLCVGRSAERHGRAIAGFMPMSGGDSWSFAWAHDGVGDGEQLVAATENPEASGPVDSDMFITSEEPSLYDTFNDMYGEPEPQRRRLPPAVALPAQSVAEPETKPAESNHAGRQFSTLRKPPRQQKHSQDIKARALLAVSGPLPVHVRVDVFHSYDGQEWHADVDAAPSSELAYAGNSWMRWQNTSGLGRIAAGVGSPASGADRHDITIGNLRSETLPLPARATRLRIDRIDQPSFYAVVADQVAALRGAAVPASTVISTDSFGGGLDGSEASLPDGQMPALTDPAPSGDRPWREILETWGVRRAGRSEPVASWRAAQQVVAHLRERYAYDPSTRPPAACPNAVEHFLTVARRGPDYLFASAAVLLLRELGYTTRLAGGFWLSSADRDPLTRRAVAVAEDAHVWCEVLTRSGEWLPVEASPAHAVRQPPWTWSQLWKMTVSGAMAIAAWLASPIPSGTLALAALFATTWRNLLDRCLTGLWWLAIRRANRCPLAATWKLLEWRAWLAGCPRPPHMTARRWYVAACGESQDFITAVEERAYATARACRSPEEHRRLARTAESVVTQAALRGGHADAALCHRKWRLPNLSLGTS